MCSKTCVFDRLVVVGGDNAAVKYWHSCLTLVTTNSKALWIRGEHAKATEDYLHRHGWDRTNIEDMDLPGECHQ